jgi:hypothetical protein
MTTLTPPSLNLYNIVIRGQDISRLVILTPPSEVKILSRPCRCLKSKFKDRGVSFEDKIVQGYLYQLLLPKLKDIQGHAYL